MRSRVFILIFVLLSLAASVWAQAGPPLAQADLDKLLAGGVSTTRVANLVGQHGIDFDPSATYLRSLEFHEKSEPLVAAVRSAGLKRILPRAQSAVKNQQWAQAEQDYRAALELDAASADAHAGLGTALLQQGRADAALPAFSEALRRDPNSAAAHRGMGLALAARKDTPGAVAALTKAAQLQPNDTLTLAALGDVRLDSGDADGATESYLRALSLDTNLPQARLGYGRALESKGNLDAAAAQYLAVTMAHPANAAAHFKLGVLWEKKGDKQGALDQYRAAFTNEPANKTYSEAYERAVREISISASASVSVKQPTGTALVHVMRKNRFQGMLANFTIQIDGRQVAKLGNGRYFTIRLPVGSHSISAGFMANNFYGQVYAPEPGAEYYYSLEIGMMGGRFDLLDPNTGRAALAKLKFVEPDRIYDRANIEPGAAPGGTPAPGTKK